MQVLLTESGCFCMKNKRKKGFTLVELTVVLVILAIIAAIAVPFFLGYWKKAEFRKNQENAKTAYLAAESRLTYYRSSGQWKKFKKDILKAAKEEKLAQKASFADDSELEGRIYAIKLDKSAKDQTTKNNLLLEILDDYTYDKGFFDASISIEIDIESGEVYSAFYASRSRGLNYASDDSDGYLTMQKREYDSRKDRLLGYYSTEDTVNSVNLEAKRLRITTINLVNSEKLYLNWSSNVGSDLGVDYDISFYNKTGDKELFSVKVSQMDMRSKGWSATDTSSSMASLTVKDASGKDQGTWQFPVTYSDNKFSLVLDAMMSAKVQATLDQETGTTSTGNDLLKTSSMSITRLSSVASDLSNPQNIYAKIKATAYAGSQSLTSTLEYRDSEQVKSNTANSMFGDDTDLTGKDKTATVTAFRHLSNIRYYEKGLKDNKRSTTSFSLSNKNMDWASAGTGVYDFKSEKTKAGGTLQKLTWKESSSDSQVGFPTISDLPAKYSLTGKGSQTLISNLYLNEESVVVDKTAGTLGQKVTQYLGLFGEIEGSVKNISFKDPSLSIGTSKTSSLGDLNSLRGVGILAGRSEGSLEGVSLTVSSSKKSQAVLEANLSSDTADYLCVGSLVGALAKVSGNDKLNSLTSSAGLKDLSSEGKMKVTLPQEKNGQLAGVGGIVGYAHLEKDGQKQKARIDSCSSSMEISSNRYAGGIVGLLESDLTVEQYKNADTAGLKDLANVIDCQSESLVRCTSDDKNKETAEGNYFGGIVGYADQALLYNVSSASGRGDNFSYSDHVDEKDQYLLGDYVGGIAGYAKDTLLANCSTEKNGYILGNDYVGGIAGGLGGSLTEAIQTRTESGKGATVNASYVIGNNYVGGITGLNQGGTVLKDCINNGVTAAYEKYVGGIVGYNGKDSTIEDCASYLSDYDNSIFYMITSTWDAKADYAGGIAGYNNGAIEFDADSEAITVKSVSSIVIGKNYVGGIAGFNDISGSLDVEYSLIGGRIYGYEDCVGGGFGFNASESLLRTNLTIQPRSLKGRYYVGGCIGANLINLSGDVTMDGFQSDNALGSITADAFCGGLIGYQRTYGAEQLTEDNGSILASLEANKDRLLPGLDAANAPTSVVESSNNHTLTITARGNNSTTLTVESNNIPIKANIYAGGILGYCEKNSKLVIKDCKNSGNISNITGEEKTVSLEVFTEAEAGGSQGDDTSLHMVGGIIGANLKNQVIDHCTNTGSMSGYSGIGGVVGLNTGLVVNCSLSEHFGNATLNYLGGIAGINACDLKAQADTDKNYGQITYKTGLIQNCSTASSKTISGKNNIGGIVGWNLENAILKDDVSYANISASGDRIGGLVGKNGGEVYATAYKNSSMQTITSGGSQVGGLIGENESTGSLNVAKSTASEEVVVGQEVSINGYEEVGGIIGSNSGNLGSEENNFYITCQANLVRASQGVVGGIVGITNGDIKKAINRSKHVTADAGDAGGITATNVSADKTIEDCKNYGNVQSNDGYAGGIVARNAGRISNCLVGSGSGNSTEIYSLGTEVLGGICAINTGTVTDSGVEDAEVLLKGDASIFGGILGRNEGSLTNSESYIIKNIPLIESNQSSLTVGGAVGQNSQTGSIDQVSVKANNAASFKDFTDYRYLGGIVGDNAGSVKASRFSGSISEKSGAAGNCYGGIAGINETKATLENCSVGLIHMTIKGVYTATSTSTAAQKESLASHAGGIVGKNEEDASITGCILDNNSESSFTASYGMLGGVAGFNKGNIKLSGSAYTTAIMSEAESLDDLEANVKAQGLGADSRYVAWKDNSNIEDLNYNDNTSVTKDRLELIMESNGNLGGITAYNGTTGSISSCVSGKWFLNNKSEALGVGTGGIIGMNESEKDLDRLINGAFVGRQLKSTVTNRFAGGIIGNQNNSTNSGWTIDRCINYGTVYCYKTHYSGGIMGQWTGSGGNIKNCRNYGNLQTTYSAGWVGASGGIVAQLYHAYEENEYNIIGCGNFGNIYGRGGSSTGNSANDSAGILGNVTTYYSNQQANGQSFRIQILDCVNGPGVEIYSASMASGIFGFLSCDNPNGENIIKSTQNVEIRIERCQNYANKLQGVQFGSGIFGDRYGTTGCQNTTVTNCYSVNRSSSYYNQQNHPIYSFATWRGYASNIKEENRANNYFAQENDSNYGWQFPKVQLDYNNTSPDHSSGANTINNGQSELSEQYAQYEFLLTDKTKNRFFIATIYKGSTINDHWATIMPSGYIVAKDDTSNAVGKVLFYLDDSYTTYSQVWNQMLAKDSDFYKLAREGYRNIEGIVDSKILAPASASASIKNGKITLDIKAKDLPGALKGEKCNPFQYNIKVSDGSNEKIYQLYTESGSFDLPEDLSGKLTVSVQAVSMFDDVEASDWVEALVNQTQEVLPTPDVKVELVRTGSSTYGDTATNYAYRFSLNNLDAYKEYSGWQVKVNVQGAATVTLSETNPTQTASMTAGTYQMTAQASGTGYESSSLKSIPVYLPKYRPSITLKTWTPQATPKVTISGETIDNLSVNIELDGSSTGNIDTPPIYRAELIGSWNGENNVVFAQTDILTVANGKASASFTDLPDYISKATNLKIRIWYAESGLGPVYTYYDVTKKADANVKILESVEDDKETWKYQFSTALESFASYFDNYKYESDKLFSWLAAPKIDSKEGVLAPSQDAKGNLIYSFSWDSKQTDTSAKYQVSLVGIDANDREVTIDTSAAYTDATKKNLKIDGSDWNYKKVKLKVTRIGDASKKQIGLSSTETFEVKQRLKQVGQPAVEIQDENELDYEISWSPLASEEGCSGYQAYIQTYAETGSLTSAEKLGEEVPVTASKDGSYSMSVNLEKYAGKRVLIYLVAKADTAGNYIDSVSGISYELEIPKRIDPPKVSWHVGWTYDSAEYLEADDFEDGGLTVSLTADKDSIPPGGSAYLLKAYVYDSEADANQATDTDPGSAYELKYPLEEAVAQMDANSSTKYSHSFGLSTKYAGKWIVFYGRISSGAGSVSSKWVKSDVYRLPYVQLKAPQIGSEVEEESQFTANVQTTPEVPGQDEPWTAKRTYLSWESVFCGDVYEVNLTGQVTDSSQSSGKKNIETKLRFLEASDGLKVQVWRAVEEKISDTETKTVWKWVSIDETPQDLPEGTKETEITHIFEIPDYSVKATGTYTAADGSTPVYSLSLATSLLAQKTEDGTYSYRLMLPDVTDMKAADDSPVSNDDFSISTKLEAYTNVSDNVPDDKEEQEQKSQTFVRSDAMIIEWKK